MALTVLDLIKGHLLRNVTIQKGSGDVLDYLVHKEMRETDESKITIKATKVLGEFVQLDDIGNTSTGETANFVADGAVVHSTARTYPSWEIVPENPYMTGEIIDPKEFKIYGLTNKMLKETVDQHFGTKDQINKVKAFLDRLQPFVEKLQKKLWTYQRSLVQAALINLNTPASLKNWQKPFGEGICYADGSTKTYYKFTNLYTKTAYDAALNNQLYDAFANDQVDWEQTDIMQSSPYLFVSAKNFHENAGIFSPDKSVNVYHRSASGVLDLIADGKKMVGSYKDPTAANANDFVMIGPLAIMYMLGKNINDESKNGIYLDISTTTLRGLQVTLNVSQSYVIESPIDIFKNKGTVA